MILKAVSVGYKNKTILNDINYSFKENKLTAIVGKNGCGKTTLLKSLAARLPILGGEITLNNKSVFSYKPRELARVLTYLPQVRDTPNITALALVEHGRFPYLGFPRVLTSADKDAVLKAMQLFNVEQFSYKNINVLSGGERQRVYLALAFAQQTSTILLDEPTTFIDLGDTYNILEIIKRESTNKTIIMVLHDIDAAMRFADEIALVDSGKIIFAATPKEMFLSNKINEVYGISSTRISEGNYHFYKE